MARPFLSNCRRRDRRPGARAARLLLPLLAGILAACAGMGDDNAIRMRHNDTGAAREYLLGLRGYLAAPAGDQVARRAQLAHAAEDGNPSAVLEYALALSVDRDDPEELQLARNLFESLLVAPDPLPVALDVLVRLQLGQVIDRLRRMRAAADLRDALRATTTDLRTALARLKEAEMQREDMRRQLAEVRRKLDALTRIEQTVNQDQDGPADDDSKDARQDIGQGDDEGNGDVNDNGENGDAERQTDTARR